MISMRVQFMKDAELLGELLEVVNKWEDTFDVLVRSTERERLKLTDMLFAFLSGRS